MRKSPASVPDGDRTDYSLAETARIIATCVQEPGESIKYAMDKVRKRLLYAVRKGELQTTGAAPGVYHLPQVVAWGRKKWPGKLDGLPVAPTVIQVQGIGAIGFSADTFVSVIPGDLPRCQAALKEALQDARTVRARLAAAEMEIDRLRPVAKRYEENRETLRQSANRQRKGVW